MKKKCRVGDCKTMQPSKVTGISASGVFEYIVGPDHRDGNSSSTGLHDTRGIFLVCTLDVVAPQSSSASSSKVLVAAIAAPVAVVVALGAIACSIILWRREAVRRHITFFSGKVKPPPAGHETTLVVTGGLFESSFRATIVGFLCL